MAALELSWSPASANPMMGTEEPDSYRIYFRYQGAWHDTMTHDVPITQTTLRIDNLPGGEWTAEVHGKKNGVISQAKASDTTTLTGDPVTPPVGGSGPPEGDASIAAPPDDSLTASEGA